MVALLMNNDSSGDGLFLKACSSDEYSNFDFEQNEKYQDDQSKEHASTQRFQHQLTFDDAKIHKTPGKLMRSLQSSTTRDCQSRSNPEGLSNGGFTREFVDSSSTVTQSHTLNYKPAGKRDSGNIEELLKMNLSAPGNSMHNDIESVSSTEVAENNTCDPIYQAEVKHKSGVTLKSKTNGTVGLRYLCAMSLIILASIFSLTQNYDDEFEFYMVPT